MAAATSSATGPTSGPRFGTPAYSATNQFLYHRNDDRFEQVMAYYWATEAQKYIQSLGFGSTRRAVNKESQDIRTGQIGIDNSFFWDKHDLLRFGKGGVDDAEDAEVILHEYGHAIQDSEVAGFGDRSGGRRDRRGLRRLLGRDGLECHRADARRPVRCRLGLGVLHLHDPALPATGGHGRPLPGGPG